MQVEREVKLDGRGGGFFQPCQGGCFRFLIGRMVWGLALENIGGR
jgi:hypothetical protein